MERWITRHEGHDLGVRGSNGILSERTKDQGEAFMLRTALRRADQCRKPESISMLFQRGPALHSWRSMTFLISLFTALHISKMGLSISANVEALIIMPGPWLKRVQA